MGWYVAFSLGGLALDAGGAVCLFLGLRDAVLPKASAERLSQPALFDDIGDPTRMQASREARDRGEKVENEWATRGLVLFLLGFGLQAAGVLFNT